MMMGIYCSWGMTCHLQCSVSATITFPLRVFPWNPCLFCVLHSFPRMAVCHVTSPLTTGSSCDSHTKLGHHVTIDSTRHQPLPCLSYYYKKLSLVYTRSCTKWGAAAIFVSEPRPVNIFCWGLQERCDPSSQRQSYSFVIERSTQHICCPCHMT